MPQTARRQQSAENLLDCIATLPADTPEIKYVVLPSAVRNANRRKSQLRRGANRRCLW